MYGMLLIDMWMVVGVTVSGYHTRGINMTHPFARAFKLISSATGISQKTSRGGVLVRVLVQENTPIHGLYLVCLMVLGCVEGVSGHLSEGFWYRRREKRRGTVDV